MSAELEPNVLWSDGACPPEGLTADIKKWFKFAYDEARSYLDSQPGVEDIPQALSIIRGKYWTMEGHAVAARSGLSPSYFNRIEINSQKQCFTLTNLSPGFTLQQNSNDETQIGIAKSLDFDVHAWLEDPKTKSQIRDWLLNMRLGVSYISPVMVDPLLCEDPKNGVECKLYNYDDVLFYQMGRDRDIQKAEATIIANTVPLERVRKIYNKLTLPADTETKDSNIGFFARGFRRIRNLWDARSFQAGVGQIKPQRMKTVYHVYINDKTINRSGQTRRMGQILNPDFDYSLAESETNQKWQDTHWTYDVPSFPSMVPSGVKIVQPMQDQFGNPVVDPDGNPQTQTIDKMRAVTEEECRLYPTKRLLVIIGEIGSKQILWYDGPSYWAHGLTPIVEMRAIDNGIDHMAGSMFRDVIHLNAEYNRVLRGVLNKVYRQQHPNMLVNERFGPDKAAKICAGYPGDYLLWNNYTGVQAAVPMWPIEFYKIAPEEMAVLTSIQQMIDFMMGQNDPQSILEKGKIPESDSIEDLYQSKGEIMEDRGRRMETAWLTLGYMVTMLMAQFDNLGARIAKQGVEAMTPADLDVDPATMIPSHLPNEDVSKPSQFSKMMRTRFYMRQMMFKVDSNSAYGFSNSERKLEAELLRTRGFPYPFDEESKLFRFKNFGTFAGNTWIEKYAEQVKWQARTQAVGISVGQIAGQLVQAAAGLSSLAAALGGGGGQGGQQGGGQSDQATATHHGQTGNPTGRPNSYGATPQMEQKDNGARTTLTTS